jgi:glycosyltransferase involved in cell wall biosynthesis
MSEALAYSVVVPSHNRRGVLREVLAALDAQQEAPGFEIVVVDDGSTDGSAEMLSGWSSGRPLRVLLGPQRGPAAARNRGVAAAHGARIAFLGDDTVPEPGWLAAHDQAFRRHGGGDEIAVVGYTGWHARVRRTPFLDHLNERGLQFGYALIDRPDEVPFNFFYTSNVSLSRRRMSAEPFDEAFPYPAWEDIEAAYRLVRAGLRLVYEPAARTAHDHPTDFARFAARQERAGYCGVVFARLHPELAGFVGVGPGGPPDLPSRGAQRLREALVRALQNLPLQLPKLWDEALRFHYIRGLRRGWKELVIDKGDES